MLYPGCIKLLLNITDLMQERDFEQGLTTDVVMESFKSRSSVVNWL